MKKQANCLRCLKYQEIGAKRHSQITGSLPLEYEPDVPNVLFDGLTEEPRSTMLTLDLLLRSSIPITRSSAKITRFLARLSASGTWSMFACPTDQREVFRLGWLIQAFVPESSRLTSR